MQNEKALVRLQNLRVETYNQLLEHFKNHVQLKEQIDDNSVKLHFCRGVIAGLDEMEHIIAEESTNAVVVEEPQAMEKKDKVDFSKYEEYAPLKEPALEWHKELEVKG